VAFSIETSPSSIGAGHSLPGASSRRILIVSNRLPTTVHLHGDSVRLSPSSGGLATGLRSIQTSSSGLWIGWSGAPDSPSASVRGDIDTCLAQMGACAVPLTEADVEGFYRGFANGVLWPLLHDGTPATMTSWDTYRSVNARFAEVVLRHWRPGDRIWIHDYHLMLLPRMLRERRPDARIGFFLHTPFSTTETLAALPDAPALIEGMLGADAIGFQTRADVDRFGEAVRALLGRSVRLASGTGVADDLGRPVRLHFSPMSVDVAGFAARAADPRLGMHLAALRAPGTPLFVGVDRLDPTKGIPERLEAFGRLLELRPELRGRARLLQLAVPSREDLPAYRALRERIELNVAALNARYGTKSWKPVELMYGQVDELELAALYRAADVMLVTPLRDGMNLVAKEFVASRVDGQGVLVLSRSAGAAAELTAALLVDPSDVGTLVSAYDRALDMSPAERRVRMTRLRASVRAHDIGSWARECLQQLEKTGSAAGGIGRWAPRGRRHV
jgi:trehalose 6-phosphate synthase/phosphatase